MIQPLPMRPLSEQQPVHLRDPFSGSDAPQPIMLDDEVLARQLFQTDPEAGCSWLFRRYYRPLCNHALRFVYSREVAEDIVGEVFCALWTDKGYSTITTSYRAYLFTAVRNRAYNYLRWELSRKSDTDTISDAATTAFSSEAQTPAEMVQFDELYQKINETIADLPPQCRRTFLMSRFEQKPYRDIAAEMGISIKAVEANISRALSALRKMLRNEFVVLLGMQLATAIGGLF
ncbi:RNA polymerase sigma-70 factor [Fibrella sp. WM1]|uniref:RNA polymerase sigma-70 factor n=1 Tax=Fibrella musci TaxID=3242485 RepID=UPI003521027A